MGLALLIVYLKTNAANRRRALQSRSSILGSDLRDQFCSRRVTANPMEFQFGTNGQRFRSGGRVIGQTLAMEGCVLFFLESSSLGLFLFGEKKLGRIGHWWLRFWFFWARGSRLFHRATDAWMQHHRLRIGANGAIELASFWDLLLNKWALWQYAAHDVGAAQTGCFVMGGVGAFYL